MRYRSLAILSAVCLAASLALACRYTVRDIGFIDLAGEIYTVWVVTDEPDGIAAQAALAGARRATDQSNVRARLLDARTRPDHPAAATPGIVLEGPGSRFLPVGSVGEHQSAVGGILSSPLREDLLAGSIGAFCTLLFVKSSDETLNAAAHEQIEVASAQFEAMAPSLPREVTLPVRRVTLASGDRESERLALWSLGLEEGAPDQPVVAVLYGRLKLAGPVLVGDGITPRTLASQLSLVGESCECEADRDWVNEASLPHRWDEHARRAAAESLGFDPGSPMVMAEAVRIIERGVLTSGGLQGPRTTDEEPELDASFFGYSEFTIGEPTTNAPEVALEPTRPITHRTIDPEASAPRETETIADSAERRAAESVGAEADVGDVEAETGSSSFPVGLLIVVGFVAVVSAIGGAIVMSRGGGA